jgi:hypothetical protein
MNHADPSKSSSPSTQANGNATRSPYFSRPRPVNRVKRHSKSITGMKAVAVVLSLASTLTPTVEGLAAENPALSSPSNKRRATTISVVTPDTTIPSTNIKKPKKTPSKKKDSSDVPRTESFGALWAGSFPDLDQSVEPHTLILGTHPSIKSLEEQQYYGHPMK